MTGIGRAGIGVAALAGMAIGVVWVVSASASEAAAPTVAGYSYGKRVLNAPPGRLTSGSLACPSGRPVVGGGVASSSRPEDPNFMTDSMTLHSSAPFDGGDRDRIPDDGWSGRVDRDEFSSGPETATIYAICDMTKTASSYAYNNRTASVPEEAERTLTVPCANGDPVTGGGVVSTGPQFARTWIKSSAPYDGPDAGTAADDGWRVTVANVGSDDGLAWTVTAHAICDKSRPPSAYGYVKRTASVPEDRQLRTYLLCGGSSHLVGGGVSLTGRFDDVLFVNTSSPLDTADPDTAEDDGWRIAVDNFDGVVDDPRPNPVALFAICRR